MIAQNIAEIRQNIKENNLDGREILLLPATKTVPPEIINTLPNYGLNFAGENRVQELISKHDNVVDVKWHFIGTLQTNKVKFIADKVCMIHSVDREKLANEIDHCCKKINKIMPVLVEINIGNEPNKSGISIEKLFELCDYIDKKDNLTLKGLMTVMPATAEERLYIEMNRLFLEGKLRYGEKFDSLSMGMSNDYITAIKNGANIIRIGRNIFGERKK